MSGKGGRFSEAKIEKIKRLARAGMKSPQIAEAVGCSLGGVKGVLWRASNKRGRPAWTAAETRAAKALAADGLSVRAACADMTRRFGREFTVGMLINRARQDGYKFVAPRHRFSARQWTAEEDAYLREILGPSAAKGRGEITLKAAFRMMKARFAASLSAYTLASHAAALGLSFAPKGERQTGGAVKARRVSNPAMHEAALRRTAPETLRLAGAALEPGGIIGAAIELNGRTLLTAGQDPVGCRYIYGEVGGDWRYCQRAQDEGSAYCAAHQALCSNGLPPSAQKRRAHNGAQARRAA